MPRGEHRDRVRGDCLLSLYQGRCYELYIGELLMCNLQVD